MVWQEFPSEKSLVALNTARGEALRLKIHREG
jgi:hypothetical protein